MSPLRRERRAEEGPLVAARAGDRLDARSSQAKTAPDRRSRHIRPDWARVEASSARQLLSVARDWRRRTGRIAGPCGVPPTWLARYPPRCPAAGGSRRLPARAPPCFCEESAGVIDPAALAARELADTMACARATSLSSPSAGCLWPITWHAIGCRAPEHRFRISTMIACGSFGTDRSGNAAGKPPRGHSASRPWLMALSASSCQARAHRAATRLPV